MIKLLNGDSLALLKTLHSETINTCITSPPYWGLRDYGVEGQIGLEKSPQEYVAKMVEIFSEVRRVLRDDGTLWLNLGDSYASAWVCNRRSEIGSGSLPNGKRENRPNRLVGGLKEKDLVGIPWRVAFALQQDGWYLRQDIIWAKPNPMPESVRDRCTKSHEYLFMLSKSPKYYFDNKAIYEPFAASSIDRLAQPNLANQKGSSRVPGKTNGNMKACGPASYKGSKFTRGKTAEIKPTVGQQERVEAPGRNKRSVWTITTKPFKEAHFATFPPDLVTPCALAGCPEQGIILDPFAGSGTVGMVANKLNRHAILFELNPEYIEIAKRRCGLT